jgi:hypothetical protein
MPNETHLLTPREVMDLLRIGRTTLHEWRNRGRVEGIQHTPAYPGRLHGGPWYYPASQPLIKAALDAVKAAR